jgi:hypothetical protein
MAPPSPERMAVLVVRLWLENGRPAELRARIVCTPDVVSREKREATAASVEDVLRIVREWVDEVVGGATAS